MIRGVNIFIEPISETYCDACRSDSAELAISHGPLENAELDLCIPCAKDLAIALNKRLRFAIVPARADWPSDTDPKRA